jgi:hypothetical protein
MDDMNGHDWEEPRERGMETAPNPRGWKEWGKCSCRWAFDHDAAGFSVSRSAFSLQENVRDAVNK